jgi:hypothetical protein
MDDRNSEPTPSAQPTPTEEAAARQARIDYMRSLRPTHPKRSKWVRVVIIIVVVLLVLAVAAALYWKFIKKDTPGRVAKGSAAQTDQQSDANNQSVPTKRFDATRAGMSFDYPQNWQVSEDPNGKVVATSPEMSLVAGNGQKQTGRIVATITPKGQGLTAFDAGSATAVLDSLKIKYTKPSSVQRAETYLSFLQSAATTTTNTLDAVYVTGDFGYQKGQAVPKTDMVKLDPVISLMFAQCGESACATPKPIGLQTSQWQNQQLSGPLLAMLTSLTVN